MAYISKISKNDLGEYVKKLRTQKGVTLIQLAAKAGCSTSSINMAENHLRNLRSDTAERVLHALGVKKSDVKRLFEKYGYIKEERDVCKTCGRKGFSKKGAGR